MSLPQRGDRRIPYFLFCALFIVLGLSSLAVGVFLLVVPHYLGVQGSARNGTVLVGGICALFGILRIGNSIYHLARLSKLNR